MSGIFPFTLAGTSFLVFYAGLAALLLIGYWYYNIAVAPGQEARLSELTSDPYKIACLRDGAGEAIRVAVVNLVDRGLLEAKGDAMVMRSKAEATDLVRRPLDRAILSACAAPQPLVWLAQHSAVKAAADQYEDELKAKGLLLDAAQRTARFTGLLVVLGILGGIAVLRILQAMSHNRPVGFLVALGLAVGVAAIYLHSGRATAAGKRALGSLQTLTKRLQGRADQLKKGGATNEALLLAAVFGIYALSNEAFAFIEELWPKPKSSGSSGCSSSGCSSGGSSCGGGGGGGCGGCGGS